MIIIKEYPVLHLDLSTGKRRFWKIWIEKEKDHYLLKREYGIILGKITKPIPIQMLDEKKMITKANALFKKKKEEGFYEEKNQKKNQIQTKQHIIRPMGAHKLDDFHQRLHYPVCVQRKLDGYRCLVHSHHKKIELLSRNMKPFSHLPHIRKELEKINELKEKNIYLDGELYSHDLKLHNIGSIVRKQYVNDANIERMKEVSYYVFDFFDVNKMDMTFEERYDYLKKNIFDKYDFQYIKLVSCVRVNNYEGVLKENELYLSEGYEGVIVRNLDGLYQWNKKSYDVLRTKEFKKGVFKVVDTKAGEGAQSGAILFGVECLKDPKLHFWVMPVGSLEERRKMMKNSKKYIGKKVIVKYLDIDSKGCVTRNPILEEFIQDPSK
jgi:ATP-dependent DNA ligase